jgi:hypothetical protein
MAWPPSVNWMRTDALAAASMCAGGILLYLWSQHEAADAVRRYGQNVDSGIFQYLIATLYCAPNAVFFAIAGVAMRSRWRVR